MEATSTQSAQAHGHSVVFDFLKLAGASVVTAVTFAATASVLVILLNGGF